MDRTSGANYDESSGVRRFKDGPPGTTVEQTFLNGIQEELMHILNCSAQTPSTSDDTQLMNTIGLFGHGLRNGVITPSVAANVLTVAIKTMSGQDPTTTNPVYVRIGNSLRKITSALYVNTTAATDHWDRTSYTYSLFVYLGWDAVNSRVEILLCPQPTYLTYPAANPAAPDPRRLISAYGAAAGTAITNGHTVQVCGRIDSVVQSAGDNYTGVSSTAISNPIYYTPLLTCPNVILRSNGADTTPVFTTNLFYYSLNFDQITMIYNFYGDGGADGAGATGPLKLDLPFYLYDLGLTTEGCNTGVAQGASITGTYEVPAIHISVTAVNYITWKIMVHSGGGNDPNLANLNPSHLTNGGRYVQGVLNFKIRT